MMTSSHTLTNCKFLMFAVTPDYLNSNEREMWQLDRERLVTVSNILDRCHAKGLTSLAMPFMAGGK